MRFEDALKLMREGKKVWINKGRGKSEHYFYIETEDGSGKQVLMCRDLLMGTSSILNQLNQGAIMCQTWEEYKKPILDEVEKTYLENLLHPFTKRYDKILVTKCPTETNAYLLIWFYQFKDDETHSAFTILPTFGKNDHMYEGMKSKKDYTLDELGLFKE